MADRHIPTIVIVVTGWLAAVTQVSAQTFVPTGRETLRGLPGIELQLEAFEPEIERDGLTRAAVQAEIARQLRDAGIIVYASQGANPSDAKAYLYVLVNSVKIPGQDQYAIGLQVDLRQTLRSLVTPINVVDAMTWNQADVIVARTGDLPRVREVIRGYVDRFIADWKSVH